MQRWPPGYGRRSAAGRFGVGRYHPGLPLPVAENSDASWETRWNCHRRTVVGADYGLVYMETGAPPPGEPAVPGEEPADAGVPAARRFHRAMLCCWTVSWSAVRSTASSSWRGRAAVPHWCFKASRALAKPRSLTTGQGGTGCRAAGAQHHVCPVIRFEPVAQHRRLDVVEVHGDRGARHAGAEAIDERHCVLLPELEVSRRTGAAWGLVSAGCPGGVATRRRPRPGTGPPPGRSLSVFSAIQARPFRRGCRPLRSRARTRAAPLAAGCGRCRRPGSGAHTCRRTARRRSPAQGAARRSRRLRG